MDKSKKAIPLRKRRGLLIIVIAALMLELLSGAQFYLTRNIMADELELRAESELTLKAILIKSHLNDAEKLLRNCVWQIEANLNQPDSAFTTMDRFVRLNPQIKGAAACFVPYYYPQKGRLYEVYARRTPSDEIETEQIASSTHDYTQYKFYQKCLDAKDGIWSEPYYDKVGSRARVSSYIKSFHDRHGHPVGFTAIDVNLIWLSDTIDSRRMYPSSFILVLTEAEEIIIHPDTARVSEDTQHLVYNLITDSTVASHQSKSGRSRVMRFNNNGRDGTVFYANMRDKPHWLMAVVCYDDEVYASLHQLRIWFLLLMLAAFAVLLFVIWRFLHDERQMLNTSQLLHEKTLEQERINSELRIANDIQQALLPGNTPTLQDISEVKLEGRLIPAKAVGGDLYNVLVRDGKLFFCIGDVSGKGVPAALIMAVTQTLFHNIILRESSPARIMDRINKTVSLNNSKNMFITLFVGVLDMPTGHLRYCNAGHDIPIVMRPGTAASALQQSAPSCEMLDVKSNLPVGLFDDFNFEMQETIIPPGTTLVLYTDGLTEARNTRHELLGLERVIQILNHCTGMEPHQLVETVIDHVKQFAGQAEQSDDLTMLAIRYMPKDFDSTVIETLHLKNDLKEVSRLGDFLKAIFGKLDIDKSLSRKLRLAIEEAVVNVISYAYPTGVEGDIEIRMDSDGKTLKTVITDAGMPFDPTAQEKADTTLAVEDRQVGGLGILLVRELMDTINYERTDNKNILTLTKKIKD